MKKIAISDMTLKEMSKTAQLSFKEKIEIAKLIDRLNLSVIEISPISNAKIDTILIKTISTCVKNSVIALPVNLTEEGVDEAWEAVKGAKKPRLQVVVPMSAVQMEYICRKKPAKVLEMIDVLVKKAAAVCEDVEFVATDATRSEPEFLRKAIECAISGGAKTITICDTAGEMITDEFTKFITELYSDIPDLKDVRVGINASDELNMGTATVLSAVKIGVDEIKTASCNSTLPSMESVLKIIRARGDTIGVTTDVGVTEFQRAAKQISWICEGKNEHTPYSAASASASDGGDSFSLSEYTDMKTVLDAVASLGYDLSEEDAERVYEEFKRTASKKQISPRELDAIVASAAMQVPQTYKLVSFVINSGNIISSTANVLLEKEGKQLSGVCIGDGPIDAAFLAIEQIVGHHYELDDFQIQSVTEGREAIGSAVVKLRSGAKVYSGNGISTDIIGASIRAYVSALNKIVYEEA